MPIPSGHNLPFAANSLPFTAPSFFIPSEWRICWEKEPRISNANIFSPFHLKPKGLFWKEGHTSPRDHPCSLPAVLSFSSVLCWPPCVLTAGRWEPTWSPNSTHGVPFKGCMSLQGAPCVCCDNISAISWLWKAGWLHSGLCPTAASQSPTFPFSDGNPTLHSAVPLLACERFCKWIVNVSFATFLLW